MKNEIPLPARIAIDVWRQSIQEKREILQYYDEGWYERTVASEVSLLDLPEGYSKTDVDLYKVFGVPIYESPDDISFYQNP